MYINSALCRGFTLGVCSALVTLCSSPLAAFTPGKDGNQTITTANTIVNSVILMSETANAAADRIRIDEAAFPNLPITVGDLLLIYQATGAQITNDNNYTYGTISNLRGAGNYELVTVTSLPIFTENPSNRGFIGISTSCGGLRNTYNIAQGTVQIIRVPQYNNLTINSGASIVPPNNTAVTDPLNSNNPFTSWNGSIGGVVAVHVNGTLLLNGTGTITATGRGFRGGVRETTGAPNGETSYNSTDGNIGARKGESIAGIVAQRGRGAAANGGGGGTSHNGAGGGGANGNNGQSWTIGNPAVNGGQGVMTNDFAAGWALDPSYAQNGNALTNSSGGGRGGYSWGQDNLNPTIVGPGNAEWDGDSRRDVGGLGGRPLTNSPTGKLFMGGGGGSAHQNNGNGGSGGNGGGLVFVIANQVQGTGSIQSNGNRGGNTASNTTTNDAAGGGGAGGTIVLRANNVANTVTLSAVGGEGGNQFWTNPSGTNETEGPGGGGGGGYIAMTGGGTPTRTASGGASGQNDKTFMLPFRPNGATNGSNGQANETANLISLCSGTITGRVFNDYNGNGIQNAGEPGIAGVEVTITPATGSPFTLLTDANGNYNALVPLGSTTAVVNGSSAAIPVGSVLTSGATPTPGGTLSQTRTVTNAAASATNNVGFQQQQPVMTLNEDPSVTSVGPLTEYTYLLTFSNVATPSTAAFAQNVVLVNTLPNLGNLGGDRQVTYLNAVFGGGYGGSVVNNNGVVTITLSQNVPAGSSGTVTLTVRTNATPFTPLAQPPYLTDPSLYNVATLNYRSQANVQQPEETNDSTIEVQGTLLVELLDFAAIEDEKSGLVNVLWSTAAEYGTAGFDVYRITEGKTTSYTKINDDFINPLGSPIDGASYNVFDKLPIKANEVRGYLLVETELSGNMITYGPIWYPAVQTGLSSNISDWQAFN